MSDVFSLLRNETTPTAAPPKRPAFSTKRNNGNEEQRPELQSDICSVYDSTISEVVGR